MKRLLDCKYKYASKIKLALNDDYPTNLLGWRISCWLGKMNIFNNTL